MSEQASGKIVAVTGASRGIGSGLVAELAGRGHTVGCLSRKGTGPEDRVVPGRLINLACDMQDEEQIKGAMADLAKEAGRIDVLINNAGLHEEGVSAELSKEAFERTMATNITGPFLACREVYPHMAAQGSGLIINIGSFFERLGARQNLAYSCSKGAMGALTRVLAVEWAREGIRLINIAPGYVRTDLNAENMSQEGFRNFLRRRVPSGDAADVGEVARLVAALIAEDLPHLTGETIFLDGGQSINL